MKPIPVLYLSVKPLGPPSRLVLTTSVTDTVALWERLTTAAEPERVQQTFELSALVKGPEIPF